MMVGVTMRSALVAAAMAAASVKKGKKRRRFLVWGWEDTGSGAAAGKADVGGVLKKEKKRSRVLVRCMENAGAGATSAKADGSSTVTREKKRRRLLVGCRENAGARVEGGDGGDGNIRDWLDLPEPAVYAILRGLMPALADVLCFSSVCRAWWSVFITCKGELFSAVSPLLVDRGSSPGTLGGFYNLMERRFYRRKQSIVLSKMNVVGVSHGHWIACSSGKRTVFLMDPMSPQSRVDLPPTPHKIRGAFMTAPLTSPDCVIVATDIDRTLYCRPGARRWARHSFKKDNGHDEKWMRFEAHRVAALGRKVYALTRNGKLVIMELLFPQPRVTVMEAKGLAQKHDSCALLVESNGDILYIADEAEHRYVVRRLDLPAREWVTLNTLGDRCLFVDRKPTSMTCTTARWEGGKDHIYIYCSFLNTLLNIHIKDGRVEHHPLPNDGPFYDWLVPSFCYQ